MAFAGGCLCGAVRFEIKTDAPLAVRQCWCRVCQYVSAGSGAVSALFLKDAVTVSGPLTDFVSLADSGSVMHRRFCARCGTPIFSEAEPRPQLIFVRVGALDDPNLGGARNDHLGRVGAGLGLPRSKPAQGRRSAARAADAGRLRNRGGVLSGAERATTMLFMVIERFRDNDMVPVYRRLRESGRTLPEGLEYVDSWIEPNFSRCFQLMRCDDPRLFQQWALEWRGLGMTLEIVPVVTSAETRAIVAPYLDGPEPAA